MSKFSDLESVGLITEELSAVSQKEQSRAKKFAKRWFIDAFTGMAHGLFVTLIAGLIIEQIGKLFGDSTIGKLLVVIGKLAKALTGAGIGAGIAKKLGADNLVIFTAMVAGMLGAQANQIIGSNYQFVAKFMEGAAIALGGPGDPVGAYVTAIIATEIGMLVSGKTKLDIIVVPITMMIVAGIVLVSICPPFIWLISTIGKGIAFATGQQPFIMGVLIAIAVGILLTMPTSSAAIMISLFAAAEFTPAVGLACAAATVGCACHMVGFAVMSYKENGVQGLISQGLGTSMLQIPNVMKKPILLVPPIVASAICGPIATVAFKLSCLPAGAGMGTSGLVGVFSMIDGSIASGMGKGKLAFGIILLMFVLPALISWFACEFLRKKGLIKFGDLKI